jgi:hypothetical protein
MSVHIKYIFKTRNAAVQWCVRVFFVVAACKL